MEIAQETLDCTFLTYAKIRVSGFSNGFLPSVLEMPQGSDFVMLGIFPLIDKQPLFSNRSARTLGPAFRRAETLRRSLGDMDSQPYGKNLRMGNEAINGDKPLRFDREKFGQTSISASHRTCNYGEPATAIVEEEGADMAQYADRVVSMEGHNVTSPFFDKNRWQLRER